MKTCLPAIVLLVLATGLGGCASTAPSVATTATPRAQPDLRNWSRDEARIARIEAQALRRGVEVQWINAPMKRKPAADPAQ